MKLSIIEIERFALHDGPGIRSTVFLQSCPLRCPWCANPESQHIGRHLMYLGKRCIGCGCCATVCESGCATMSGAMPTFERTRCTGCGRCVDACPAQALRLCGEEMETSDILSVLLRDQSYYQRTGGGITVSGGEPLMQADGLKELLSLCKAAGLHTAVETTGNVSPERITVCEPFIDLFLYDIKHSDPRRFAEKTKGDLSLVLSNLSLVPPGKTILRVPVIPGFNFDEETLRQIFELALEKGIHRVDLLPYHMLGKGKYEQLGLAYPYGEEKALTKRDLSAVKVMGESMGLVIG